MEFEISSGASTETKLDWKYSILATVSLLTSFILFLQTKVLPFQKSKSTPVYLSVSDIPGPTPCYWSNFIGNLPQILPATKFCKQMVKWAAEYPEILKFTGLNATCVVLISPTLIQQLFKSSDLGHGVKVPFLYDHLKSFMPNALVRTKGRLWQKQRHIFNKSQSFNNIKGFMPVMNKHAVTFVKKLKQKFQNGEEHQINDLIKVTFLKIIMEITTGQDQTTSAELIKYFRNQHRWDLCMVERFRHPWLLLDFLWNLHPTSKVQRKCARYFRDFAKKQIQTRQVCREKRHTQTEVEEVAFTCIVDDLLGSGISQDQIEDGVNSTITGGYGTVSSVIHCFCLVIGQNPEQQKLCQQEVDEVFNNPELLQNGQISYATANSGLKYIERCIQETMRLFPPAFIFGRQIESPVTLELNEKKYNFPTGSILAISPLMTHHCPKYFPNSEKFDPDRFLPEETAKRPKCSFIPFSGGPRACMASRLAELEMKIVVAHLLYNFNIRSKDEIENVTFLPYIMLTPEKDFTFELTRRQHCM